MEILDYYLKVAPTVQNAMDIFKGEWALMLPTKYKDSYVER